MLGFTIYFRPQQVIPETHLLPHITSQVLLIAATGGVAAAAGGVRAGDWEETGTEAEAEVRAAGEDNMYLSGATAMSLSVSSGGMSAPLSIFLLAVKVTTGATRGLTLLVHCVSDSADRTALLNRGPRQASYHCTIDADVRFS